MKDLQRHDVMGYLLIFIFRFFLFILKASRDFKYWFFLIIVVP